MFKFESPVFIHKHILKKEMLEELRDYPLEISRMLLGDHGSGILKGTELTWEADVLTVHPGLALYQGDIYRMEKPCTLACPPTDRMFYIKVRFAAPDGGQESVSRTGSISISTAPPEDRELELGRFRLQEGARLRTAYEDFSDYRTRFDTVDRIHMPWACTGGAGLWPVLLLAYARELLASGTEDPYDISFAMQLLGNKGETAAELVVWYVEHTLGAPLPDTSNGNLYDKLLQILSDRRSGGSGRGRTGNRSGQMLLL